MLLFKTAEYGMSTDENVNTSVGGSRGVAKGGPGTPNPIPLKKLLRIKRVRTRHALRIRLIEL